MMETKVKGYDHKIMDSNTSYFRFFEEATQDDYQSALEDCVRTLSMDSVTKLIVVNDVKGEWNKTIEEIWKETGRLSEMHGIKKWGVVVPNSAIREMSLKRVVKAGGYYDNIAYDFFFSQDIEEVMEWIKKD